MKVSCAMLNIPVHILSVAQACYMYSHQSGEQFDNQVSIHLYIFLLSINIKLIIRHS